MLDEDFIEGPMTHEKKKTYLNKVIFATFSTISENVRIWKFLFHTNGMSAGNIEKLLEINIVNDDKIILKRPMV